MSTASIDMLLDQSHDLLADSVSSPRRWGWHHPHWCLLTSYIQCFFCQFSQADLISPHHFVRNISLSESLKNKHLRSSNLPQLQERWRELVSHKTTSVEVTLLPASCWKNPNSDDEHNIQKLCDNLSCGLWSLDLVLEVWWSQTGPSPFPCHGS